MTQHYQNIWRAVLLLSTIACTLFVFTQHLHAADTVLRPDSGSNADRPVLRPDSGSNADRPILRPDSGSNDPRPSTATSGTSQNSAGDASQGGVRKLMNPFGDETNTLEKLILKVIDVILVFLIPIIVLYIMYAGFLYVTARGNSEQIGTAHRALLYALIGGVIVIGAKIIVEIIQGTVTQMLR